MDGAQIRIFEQTNHVGFAGFLDREHCLALESQIALVLSGNLTNQALEGKLSDEQFSRLLELSDLTECDSAGSETMRLLDALVGHISSFAGRFLR